jgi:hypothetical protein
MESLKIHAEIHSFEILREIFACFFPKGYFLIITCPLRTVNENFLLNYGILLRRKVTDF